MQPAVVPPETIPLRRQIRWLERLQEQLTGCGASQGADVGPADVRKIATVVLACYGVSPTVPLQGEVPPSNCDGSMFHYPFQLPWSLYIAQNAAAFDALQQSLLSTRSLCTRDVWALLIALTLNGIPLVLHYATQPRLAAQHTGTMAFTRYDCAVLTAAGLLGVLSTREMRGSLDGSSVLSFFTWLTDRRKSCQLEKLKCLMSYFAALSGVASSESGSGALPRSPSAASRAVAACTLAEALARSPVMQETVTVTRRVGTRLDEPTVEETDGHCAVRAPDIDDVRLTLLECCTLWSRSAVPLRPVTVLPNHAVQDCDGCLQADFACRYLGGGVLRGGCAQEEILFTTFPEALPLISRVSPMEANESLLLEGMERFAEHSGYSWKFRYVGPAIDRIGGGRFLSTPLDATGQQRATAFVAIDAVEYTSCEHARSQYTSRHIVRDLLKVYTALRWPLPNRESETHRLSFATGHWGCGVYRGDPYIKCLIQWLAASQAHRDMVYCWQNASAAIEEDLRLFYTMFRTVGQLMKAILRAAEKVIASKVTVWDALKQEASLQNAFPHTSPLPVPIV